MRITWLLYDYPPHRFIGAEIAAHRLVKALQAHGHQVEVRILSRTAAQWDGVRAAPHGHTPFREVDVVMTNVGLATRARALWTSTPLVVWAHNNQVSALLDAKEAHPQLLVTNTDHMRDVFLSVNGQDSLVLYPIPDPTVRPDPARVGEAWTLINGSRDKGGEVIRTVAMMCPDEHFLVVRGGHGPQVSFASPNVELVAANGTLEHVWSRTRALLIPSRLESYSMVGFEAQQRGVPTLARSLPGVVEALGNREAYVHTREPDDWANAIREWPEEPLTGLGGAARRAHVARRLDTVHEQTERLVTAVEALTK